MRTSLRALIFGDADAAADPARRLLETAWDQWRSGAWESLAGLETAALSHHPDRAVLHLFAAAARLELGDLEAGRSLARQARDLGCPLEIYGRVLLAGAHRSLGRAAGLCGESDRAAAHFAAAADQDAGEPVPDAPAGNPADEAEIDAYAPPEPERMAAVAGHLAATEDGPTPEALDELSRCAQEAAGDAAPLPMSMIRFRTYWGTFRFAHVVGDHIPIKMARAGNFYEAEFLACLRRFHRPGGLVVDCGANIGNHSVYFATALGARLLAVEPQPHNVVCLAVNVALNGVADRVRVLRCALGQGRGRLTLRMALTNNFGSFTARPGPPAAAGGGAFDVPLTSLDALLPSRPVISILKIDVEGMELDILRGGLELVRRSRPLIALECVGPDVLGAVEGLLRPVGYFLADVYNATPTCLFLNRDNMFHVLRLEETLRERALDKEPRLAAAAG